jgi:hemolysin activation/secretion protein
MHRHRRRGREGLALAGLAGVLLAAALVSAPTALAQGLPRPGDERPEIEEFPPEEPPPAPLELPPIPPVAEEDRGRLSLGRGVFVKEFRVEGSTVFTADELTRVVAPYAGRAITSEELLHARDAVTQHYIEAGYLTSGATIPDQSVEDGVVRIRVVEGVLAEVEVEGTRRFRPHYFRSRLERAGRAPVNVVQLEEQLQRFQRDPLVERVHATLLPGQRRGEAKLRLVVEEARPYALSLGFANDEPPGIGSLAGHIGGSYANLLGHSDELAADFAVTAGLRDIDVRYRLPVSRFDTRLELRYRYSQSDVVEDPFAGLDIFSRSTTYGVGLNHPAYRSPSQELWIGITAEYRESETFLGNDSICFQGSYVVPEAEPGEGGGVGCEPMVAVARLFQDWSWRTASDVIAARSTLSLGYQALRPSSDENSADSRLVSWLGQVQWAHRFPERLLGTQLLARLDTQLAADPLLSIEKFSVGGVRTVRGYRENQLVRDNGLVASLELRVPLLRDPLGRPLVQLAPFADFGRAWDERGELPARSIASLGLGLRVFPWDWLRGEFYWGARLKKLEKLGSDLQDHGFHFNLVVTPFDALP